MQLKKVSQQKYLNDEYMVWAASHDEVTEDANRSIEKHLEACKSALESMSDLATAIVWEWDNGFCINTFDIVSSDALAESFRLRKMAHKLGGEVFFKPDLAEYIRLREEQVLAFAI